MSQYLSWLHRHVDIVLGMLVVAVWAGIAANLNESMSQPHDAVGEPRSAPVAEPQLPASQAEPRTAAARLIGPVNFPKA